MVTVYTSVSLQSQNLSESPLAPLTQASQGGGSDWLGVSTLSKGGLRGVNQLLGSYPRCVYTVAYTRGEPEETARKSPLLRGI
jgi:hypothetical protein